MRTASFSVVAVLAMAVAPAGAWAQASGDAGMAPRHSLAAAQHLVAYQAAEEDADQEQWRYLFYYGTWWYWMPDNHWVVWTGDRWIDYDQWAASFAATPTYQAQPSYDYGSGYYYGRNYYGSPGYGNFGLGWGNGGWSGGIGWSSHGGWYGGFGWGGHSGGYHGGHHGGYHGGHHGGHGGGRH